MIAVNVGIESTKQTTDGARPIVPKTEDPRNVGSTGKGKVKRTCIAPFVKLQLKALRYG